MSTKSKLIEGLKTLLSEFNPARKYSFMKEGVTSEGVKIITEAPDFTEGVEVFVEVEGVVQAAPNGTHTLEDGTVIEVAEGKIVTVTKVEAAADTDLESLKTEIETTLRAVDKDRKEFATQLSAANAELVKLKADQANAITEKDKEITNLKAEIVTLKSQVKSVQDGNQKQDKSEKEIKLREDGKPEAWKTFDDAQRRQWYTENLNLKSKTVN